MAKVKTIVCPECGVSLRPEQIQAHIQSHWGDSCPDRIHFQEASRRYLCLLEFALSEGVVFQRAENSL